MNNTTLNEQTNEDIFILDLDQLNRSSERPSTPPPNDLLINQPRTAINYDIVKTANQHVVLVHKQQPIDTTNVEDDQGTTRRITRDNPVIPDDVFLSHISSYSSSEGYCSGSDWDTDSTWRSYESMRDDLPNLFDTPISSISQFILPEATGYRSRGLSQPQLSCWRCIAKNPVYEERNGK